LLVEEELLRTGEDERPSPPVIHESLEVGEERRDTLDLVQHDATASLESSEESPGVFGSFCAVLEVFERDVVVVGKGHVAQSALTGLTGTSQEDHWILPCPANEK